MSTIPLRPDGLPEAPPMPTFPRLGWAWRAQLVRVVDGDTLDVELDRGFRDRSVRRLRLMAVNVPERGTAEGQAAIAFVTDWLREREALTPSSSSSWPLRVLTMRADRYGERWDAWVWAVKDGACLNQDLIASGHAQVWSSLVPSSSSSPSPSSSTAQPVAFAATSAPAPAPAPVPAPPPGSTTATAAAANGAGDSPGMPDRIVTSFGAYLTAVVQAIDDFAEEVGLPPNALLAVGLQESSLDPYAVGDNGQSYGVFQIYLPAHGGAPETWTGLDGLSRSMTEMRARWVSTFAAAGGWSSFVNNPQEFLQRWAPAAQGSKPWTADMAARRLGQADVLLIRYLRLRLAAAVPQGLRDLLDGLTLAAQGLDDLVARAGAMADGCRAVIERYRTS